MRNVPGEKRDPAGVDIVAILTHPNPQAAFEDDEGLIVGRMQMQRGGVGLAAHLFHHGQFPAGRGGVQQDTHQGALQPLNLLMLLGGRDVGAGDDGLCLGPDAGRVSHGVPFRRA